MDSSWDRDERRSPSSESLKVKATPSFHDPMPHLDIASGAGNTLSHDQAQGSTYLPDDPVVPRKSGDSPALNEGDREYGDFEPGLENDLDPTKSLLENKCLMLSKEIDAMGMGKYQICIFFLCGLGFLIDLLWAQALGLIIAPIQQEFGVPDAHIGQLSTVFSTGLTVGAFFWGIMLDVVGRKWAFYLTCLTSSIFGLCSGAPNSFAALCVLMAFVGLGVGGNIPIDATIAMEFLPTNRRFLVATLSVFQPMGVVLCSAIAYGLVPPHTCALVAGVPCRKADNMGWRYLMFCLGGITLGVFLLRFLVFKFRESPQFLLSRGRDAEAIEVVRAIARMNGARPPNLSLEDFGAVAALLGEEDAHAAEIISAARKEKLTHTQMLRKTSQETYVHLKRIKIIFSTFTMGRVTLIIWLTFIADFWGFSLAGSYLPIILAKKGAAEDLSVRTTYRNYIIIYACGIPATILATFMIEIPNAGRQWTMVVSSALMAVSLFCYTLVASEAGSVGLNAMEYFFQSLFNAILYAFVPEAYPASIRGSASGFASTWGRLASIVAPIAGGRLYNQDELGAAGVNPVLYLAGGVTLICPIALALLPYDTNERLLS